MPAYHEHSYDITKGRRGNPYCCSGLEWTFPVMVNDSDIVSYIKERSHIVQVPSSA